ncbi:MAG TPA: HEAT repeat domain-containing protein, partial [Armatimonadota bacterium]|nr:HEAT repeat domain-containing protein [Armatimonadota bacterium]
ELRDPRTVGPLRRALADPSADVRDAALTALVRIGAPAVEAICAALRHKDPLLREAAADALGTLREPEAISALCSILQDEYPYVRAKAAEALGKIGRKEASFALRARLLPVFGEVYPEVIAQIRTALECLRHSEVAGLPLPAAPPAADAQSLPRPSGAPLPEPE